jgi:integrase
MTPNEKATRDLGTFLEEIGPSRAVETFLRGYGNLRTKSTYAMELALYFRWLKLQGVELSPDELVLDNLKCVFESRATDVQTKRKHTDLMSRYVNDYMTGRDAADASKSKTVAAIRGFYSSNDSGLFGHYRLSTQKAQVPSKPLFAEDIRKVLLAMDARLRTPLLVSWQTSMEINRVLVTKFPVDQAPPVRVDLYGRKKHRKAYCTFLGADSVEHLRLLPRGMPAYNTLLDNFRSTARKLISKGMLKNQDPASYHPHALRHSFETEASHAGVKAEIRDYFMGHLGGIMWTYNHRDEIHPEDLVKEYRKIEPFVSLNETETTLREEFDTREKQMLTEYLELRRAFEELKAEFRASQSACPSPRSGA